MKCVVLFCIAVIFRAAVCDDKYITKYDDVNLDEILNNERIYVKYFLCLKGEGKCTPDARELKGRWCLNSNFGFFPLLLQLLFF